MLHCGTEGVSKLLGRAAPPAPRPSGLKLDADAGKNAIAHLEKAATSFEMAQELQQDNQAAQKGEEEVQKDLARLREMMAQRAEA
jgi:hypothetical protein